MAILSFFKRKDKASIKNRQFQRYECSVVGTMRITHKNYDLDGMVLEVSEGGVNFRTATTYILNRNGEEVIVNFAGLELAGVIVATRPAGYGVQLNEAISPDLVQRIASKFGFMNNGMSQFAA